MEEMEMKIIESSADPYITGHFHAAQKKKGKISSATLGQQGKYLKELLLHQSEYFINESGGNKKKKRCIHHGGSSHTSNASSSPQSSHGRSSQTFFFHWSTSSL